MEDLDLVGEVNEKFLWAILEVLDPTGLHTLTSAYLNFAHAVEVMQGVELRGWDELDGEDP